MSSDARDYVSRIKTIWRRVWHFQVLFQDCDKVDVQAHADADQAYKCPNDSPSSCFSSASLRIQLFFFVPIRSASVFGFRNTTKIANADIVQKNDPVYLLWLDASEIYGLAVRKSEIAD